MANSAKSELLQLFQKAKLPLPKFTTVQVSDDSRLQYVSELTCERVETNGVLLMDECAFRGRARQKKAAEQDAAANALHVLREHPALIVAPRDQEQTAAAALLSCCTSEVLRWRCWLRGWLLRLTCS
jgi:hypothetical protein